MKPIIPFNELISNISICDNMGLYFINNSGIDNQVISNLMLCILFHNEKISRKSFTARMSNKGNTRVVGTYYSKVLNQWFTETHMTNILIIEAKSCVDLNLTFEKYFEYLNIGLNRNRNFCVDIIAIGIFDAILKNNSYKVIVNFINASNLLKLELNDYESFSIQEELSFGYCCEDCDGSLESFNRFYETQYKPDIRIFINMLKEVFIPMKSHLRNEYDKVINW